jgi:glycosyltransferase involved in cell wall biosynthesis
MVITLITVTYNSKLTLIDTIKSVVSQSYPDIEYVVIDGASSDGTREILKSYGNKISKIISEPDNGIYDAMNKGIKFAIGDIIGILNSDDYFHDNYVVEKIAEAFEDENVDAVYGDVQFVHPGNLEKVVRYYSSKKFNVNKFKYGYMPAHPSFYVRRKFFEQFGYYSEDYQIAADFELLLRFLYQHKLRCKYLEMPFVTMRTGGMSTKSLKSNIILNNEILRACKENGVKTNLVNIYSKYFVKIFELMVKGKK